MAIVATASSWQAARASTTLRQFRRAVLIAGLAVAVGCLIYSVETYVLRSPRRFLENPTDVMMRAFGLAHFCIGWLFLFTSPQLRSGQALVRLGLLTLIGIGLCAAFALGGGLRNPFLLIAFYGYFLVHEVRDETTLYQKYGDAPDDSPESRRFLTSLSWAVAVLLTAFLILAHLLHGNAIPRMTRYTSVPLVLSLVGLAVLLTGGIALTARAIRAGLRASGDVYSLLTAHMPLLLVYAGILTILVFGSLFGSVGFNLIILVHVTTWLVFVPYQLRRRPAPHRANLWHWFRSTPSGFVTLHLAVAGVILVLMGMRVYVWQRDGIVSELLARSSFPYWSLMHISMAFWRSR